MQVYRFFTRNDRSSGAPGTFKAPGLCSGSLYGCYTTASMPSLALTLFQLYIVEERRLLSKPGTFVVRFEIPSTNSACILQQWMIATSSLLEFRCHDVMMLTGQMQLTKLMMPGLAYSRGNRSRTKPSLILEQHCCSRSST